MIEKSTNKKNTLVYINKLLQANKLQMSKLISCKKYKLFLYCVCTQYYRDSGFSYFYFSDLIIRFQAFEVVDNVLAFINDS